MTVTILTIRGITLDYVLVLMDTPFWRGTEKRKKSIRNTTSLVINGITETRGPSLNRN